MALTFRHRRARQAGAPSSLRSTPHRAAPPPRVDDKIIPSQVAPTSPRRRSTPARSRRTRVAARSDEAPLPQSDILELLSQKLLGESLRAVAATRSRFQAACRFFAQADKLLATARGDRPPPKVVARWWFGVWRDDPEAADLISENVLPGFLSAKEQAAFDAEIARLAVLALGCPPVLHCRGHASLRAELLRTLDPYRQSSPRRCEADERIAESRRNRRSVELFVSQCVAGVRDWSDLPEIFRLYWKNARTADRHLRKALRRTPLVSFVAKAIRQADLAAREAGDGPLSETQRAWIGWSYMTAKEQVRTSHIGKRLRESVPPASRPPSREVSFSAEAEEEAEPSIRMHEDPPGEMFSYASEAAVRKRLVDLFQLVQILHRYEQGESLSPGEIARVKRVDLLLLHLFPQGKTFLTAPTYALPWLGAIGAARERLLSKGALGRSAAEALDALESFYLEYSPGRPALMLSEYAVRDFALAVSQAGLRQQFGRQLAGALRFATGAGMFRKGSPERRLIAGIDLIRALESERVGVSRRARACPDYPRSEAALIAARLRGRAERFMVLARDEPRPGDLLRRALSLRAQIEVLIERLGGPDADVLKLWCGIKPQFEALVEACRGRESLRTAAVRFYWPAQDLAEGFTDGKVKGLRRLFRLRQQSQERFEDVFSSV